MRHRLGLALVAAVALTGGAVAAPSTIGPSIARVGSGHAVPPVEASEARAIPPQQLAQLGEMQGAAAAVARVGQLEEELRRLRGRVEALEYEQRQQTRQLEQTISELRRRLDARDDVDREPGVAAREPEREAPAVVRPGATSVTPPLPPARPTPPAPPAQARVQPTPAEPPPARGGSLGTIPRDALPGSDTPQSAARSPSTPPPGGSSPSGRYAAARDLLQRGDWESAEHAFKRFVEDFPDDPQAANASYWLGETYFVREDWRSAAATFASNYRTFGPEATRAPDNLLKLGVSLSRLGDKAKACQTFAELDRRHSNASTPVRQALARERSAAGCS